MRGWIGLLFAAGMMAQDPAPPGVVRGTFLESESSGGTGQFSLRTAANSVYRFTFDESTYVERLRQRVAIAGLQRGEPLEVVSDTGRAVPRLRYARIVRVVEAEPGVTARTRLFRGHRAPTEDIIPRGTITFAGIVLRRDAESVTLRTPSREIRRVLLRPDTRFLKDGLVADASALAVNTKAFVRAGESLERDIEAYQVTWGEILKPRP